MRWSPTCLCAALLLVVSGSAEAVDLDAPAPRWTQREGAWAPDGGATWSSALDRTRLAADQFVEATITVLQTGTSAGEPWEDKPSPFGVVSRGDGVGISRDFHATYGEDRSGESDLTGDAGLYLRYRADGGLPSFYRVQLMARGADGGQVMIYTPLGGIVAAKPYAFAPGTAYVVRAAVQGNTVSVSVAGAEVLRWSDGHAARPLAGQVGIGALRAKVTFAAVRTGELKPTPVVAPATMRQFKLRPWNAAYPHLWLFDGDEPVFQLYDTGTTAELRSVKIRPSHRPVLETIPLQVTQWAGDAVSLSMFTGLTEVRSGATWQGTFNLAAKAGDATATIVVGVSFDAAKNAYVIDYAPTITCRSAWPVQADIEWLDLFPAAIMGQRTAQTPSLRQNLMEWFVWEQPGGKQPRKQNMTHHWRMLGVPEGGTSRLFTSASAQQDVATNGLAAWGTDPHQNLAVRVTSDGGNTQFVELCEWALDVHWRMRTPQWRAAGVPAGTRISPRALITSEPAAVIDALRVRALHQLDGVAPPTLRPQLTWPTTTFEVLTDGFAPANNAAFFTGGTLDRAGGVGGSAAIRLDAMQRSLTLSDLGKAGHFPAPFWRFGERTLSCKARTQVGSGTFTLSLSQRTWRAQQQDQAFTVGTTWTTCVLPADALNAMHEGSLLIRHEHGSPVWIDDLTFSEVPIDQTVDAVFEPEAYLSESSKGYLVKDPTARNGYAVSFANGNDHGGIYLNAYDTALPAGEYEVLVRCKVSNTTITEPLAELWFSQRNIRGIGAAQPLSGANGKIRGTSLSAANVYQDVRFVMTRDAAGGLEPHLEYQPGAKHGIITIDRIAVRRIWDAWGRAVNGPGAVGATPARP